MDEILSSGVVVDLVAVVVLIDERVHDRDAIVDAHNIQRVNPACVPALVTVRGSPVLANVSTLLTIHRIVRRRACSIKPSLARIS